MKIKIFIFQVACLNQVKGLIQQICSYLTGASSCRRYDIKVLFGRLKKNAVTGDPFM